MTKRKRRLEKSIVSISKQIELHEEKKRDAEESGEVELAGYYEKEIRSLESEKERRKKLLEKE